MQDRYDTFVERLDDFISGLIKRDATEDLDLMISALINVATDMAVALYGDEARKELLEILEIRLAGAVRAARNELN
jgi:hypothetical protein